MDKLRETIRPTDWILAVLLSGLGVVLMVGNMTDSDGVRVDSTSWLMIPVFLVATAVVLFRRVNMPAVVLTAIAAMAVHLAAFGWDVRCGAGLPLALVLAYSAGRFMENRVHSLLTLIGTFGLQYLVLVQDSAAHLDPLPVTAALGLAVWGIGLFVQSRTTSRAVVAGPAVPVGSRG